MRVVIFIDGKNFYSGWKDRAAGARVDFEKLSQWLVNAADGSVLWGAYYYTGVETGAQASTPGQVQLARFLDDRENDRGFFVKRFPRRAKIATCSTCGGSHRFTQEKEVDTTMVADMLSLAAVNAFDVAVLVSGDADHAPAVEGVRGLGKKVVVATWGTAQLSPRIRKAAFHHVDLCAGLGQFSTPRPAPTSALAPAPAVAPAAPPTPVSVGAPVPPAAASAVAASTPGVATTPAVPASTTPPTVTPAAGPARAPDQDQALRAIFLDELARAEKRFPFVGVNYFLTSWRSPRMALDVAVRRRVLGRLEAEGLVETYMAPAGDRALRRRPKP